MNYTETVNINTIVLDILKKCPLPQENSCESLKQWIELVAIKMQYEPRAHAQVNLRLMYIWLMNCKGIVIGDIEQ